MKLSIVIPIINEESTLQRLIDRLKESPFYDQIEVLVSDGGSTDNSKLICDRNNISVIESLPGRAVQMNHGARATTGDILYFIHADTIPPATFFEDIERALADGFKSGCYRFKFESKHPLLYVNSYCTRFDRLWLRGGDQTLFVTREVFDKLNGFDEYYTIMEEYDLIRRLKAQYNFRIMPKSVLVSARKYIHNSWLRVQLVNAKAVRMFMKGEAPDTIREFYKRSLKSG